MSDEMFPTHRLKDHQQVHQSLPESLHELLRFVYATFPENITGGQSYDDWARGFLHDRTPGHEAWQWYVCARAWEAMDRKALLTEDQTQRLLHGLMTIMNGVPASGLSGQMQRASVGGAFRQLVKLVARFSKEIPKPAEPEPVVVASVLDTGTGKTKTVPLGPPKLLTMGKDIPSPDAQELLRRRQELQATIAKYLPDFTKAARSAGDVIVLHQDAFAVNLDDDEYMLLGMAIKYAGLFGQAVQIMGRNDETFKR